MSDYFQSQINVANFDIGFNILSKVRPIILLANEFSGLINIKIACKKVIVMLANKLCSNGFRYKQ